MGELYMDDIDRMLLEEYQKQQLKSSVKNEQKNENKSQDKMLPAHNLYIEFLPDNGEICAS